MKGSFLLGTAQLGPAASGTARDGILGLAYPKSTLASITRSIKAECRGYPPELTRLLVGKPPSRCKELGERRG
jgi:hypothetical protein